MFVCGVRTKGILYLQIVESYREAGGVFRSSYVLMADCEGGAGLDVRSDVGVSMRALRETRRRFAGVLHRYQDLGMAPDDPEEAEWIALWRTKRLLADVGATVFDEKPSAPRTWLELRCELAQDFGFPPVQLRAVREVLEAASDLTILRHSIEHEVTHYRHGDHIWSLLRGVCLALHWHNPLVWWAAVLSHNDAELACDGATIKRIGENERAGYGRILIGMTCQKRPALLLTAMTMTGSKSSIKERIMLITKKAKTAIYTLVAVVLIAALATFIQALMSDATSAGVDISVEVDEKVPTAVIDYATDYVLQVVDSWNNGTPTDGGVVANVNKIIDAKITGLTQIDTGTTALDHSINMYLLEYRLLPEDQDSIILAGGMQTELMDGQSWLTEWGSAGQPYLLFLCDENDNWTRICVTNTDVIEQDYGTLEMLAQYGNAYTAAAMELYEKYKDGENAEGGNDETPSPTAAVNSLFDSGEGVELTLNLANDGVYNTYYASDWYAGRFEVLLNGYEWTELAMPSPEPSDFWLTAISTDGKQSVTFWADSGAGTVQYSSATGSTYWSAKPIDEYPSSIAEDIRAEYDNLDVSYSRISFYLSGSAEDAAEAFVHSAYGSHKMNLAPGSMYGISDYEVVDWDVREVSEDDSAVVGWFQCAVIPLDVDSPGIWAGNTSTGTGKYEGWLTYYREFVLQRQEDGYWHCIGFGTGGYSLPE